MKENQDLNLEEHYDDLNGGATLIAIIVMVSIFFTGFCFGIAVCAWWLS